jgi:hypothetical protein
MRALLAYIVEQKGREGRFGRSSRCCRCCCCWEEEGGGGEDFRVGVGDEALGVVGTGDDNSDLAPQLQYIPSPLTPNEEDEKGGETPILISPPPAGPEITVAGYPAMMSIPIPKSRAEKRDKEAGNPHSSSSSSSSSLSLLSSLSWDPWTRGRGNACPPTGVCSGLVSGVVVNDEGSSSLASSFKCVVGFAQEEDSRL